MHWTLQWSGSKVQFGCHFHHNGQHGNSAILDAHVAEEKLEDTQEEVPSVSSKPLTIIDITQFSSVSKLLSVTAYVLQFVQNCWKSVTSQLLGPLTVPELTAANQKWLYNNTFAHEISNLQSGGSRLQLVRQLRLFLDKNGLLRCGGCIHNAPLCDSAKFPCHCHHVTTSQSWSLRTLIQLNFTVESMPR